jgi:hypothetical protein
MGTPRKPTPTKFCIECGKAFNRKLVGKRPTLECASNFMRRKFCSIACSVSYQHAREAPTVAASRKRAMKHNIGSCEACGLVTETVVHHVDCEPMNNNLANLQTLCTYCHSFWHAMHKRIGKQPSTRMPPMVELANFVLPGTLSFLPWHLNS